MIALHIGKHVEDDTSFYGGFGVFSTAVGGGLEHLLAFLGLGVFDAAPLSKDSEVWRILFPQGFGTVEKIRYVKVLQSQSDENVNECLRE